MKSIWFVPLLLMFSAIVSAAPKADVWDFWAQSDETNTAIIDHSAWDDFLQEYVVTDDTGLNRVVYADAAEDREGLDGYLNAMLSLDPRSYSQTEQFAYWINLYNALTVQLILDEYPVSSITKISDSFFAFGPWGDDIAEIAGQTLTLNDIEHRILRPIWQDARIHFAVNCASIGCPNLQNTAFTGENLEELLAKGATDYLSHPRGVDASGKRLKLSSIFDWYGVDFGDNQAAVLQSLAGMAPSDVAETLQSYKGKVKYDYDWGLNDAE